MLSFQILQVAFVNFNCISIPKHLLKKDSAYLVRKLDLSSNKLISLRDLEPLVNLQELIADSNELGQNDSLELPWMPRLQILSLNKNNISNLQTLLEELSQKCPALTYLSLIGNPTCPLDKAFRDRKRELYRYEILHTLPNLRFLDSTAVTWQERYNAVTFCNIWRKRNESRLSRGSNSEDSGFCKSASCTSFDISTYV